MHSAFLRLNVVFFYAVSTLFVLACGCAAQYWMSVPGVACSMAMPEITRLSDEQQANSVLHSAARRKHNTDAARVHPLHHAALTCAPARLLSNAAHCCSSRQFHRPAPQWEHATSSFEVDAGEGTAHSGIEPAR